MPAVEKSGGGGTVPNWLGVDMRLSRVVLGGLVAVVVVREVEVEEIIVEEDNDFEEEAIGLEDDETNVVLEDGEKVG